jgi:hypothetical protein
VRRYLAYLTYVLRHKWYVFQAGWKLGIPVLAALHDNSKFLPDEFLPYARFFHNLDGTKRTDQPGSALHEESQASKDFAWAWLRHIQRNKHHPQYWVIIESFHCDCPYVMRAEGFPRTDVLLNDSGIARCLTCGAKRHLSHVHYMVADMPMSYRKEMLADWIGVGKALKTPGPLVWYATRGQGLVLHPRTRAWIEAELGYS